LATNPKPIRKLLKKFSRKRGHGVWRGIAESLKLTGDHYILYKRKPIHVKFYQWAIWFEDPRRRIIKRTNLPGDIRVSTVFLGLDHRYHSSGLPILFETMIFGGDYDNYQARYVDYESALAGHQKAIEKVFEV